MGGGGFNPRGFADVFRNKKKEIQNYRLRKMSAKVLIKVAYGEGLIPGGSNPSWAHTKRKRSLKK